MKLASAFLSLALSIALAAPAQAGVNRWTRFGPGGGIVGGFAVVPGHPSTVYAAGEGGIFRSLDGGESWTWRGVKLYGPFAADPEEPGTLYAAENFYDEVYRSLNGGASWAPLPAKPGGEIPTDLKLLQAVGGILYGGGDRGAFTSVDRGESWTWTALSGAVTSVAVVPGQPLAAFAGTHGGVWKTSDGGLHWSPLFQKPPGSTLPGIVAVSPARHDRLYFATGGEVYRTDDGGIVWQRVSGLADVTGLTVDEDDTVFAAVRDGVRISADLGATWQRTLSVSPVFDSIGEVVGVFLDPDRPGRVYAPTLLNGLFASDEGGLTWFNPAQEGLGLPRFLTLRPDPRRPGTIYLDRLTAKSEDLLRSIDGGRTWMLLPQVPGEQRHLAFDPESPDTFYVIGNGIHRVDDGGETWSTLNAPPLDSSIGSLLVRGDRLVVGSGNAIYRSVDGGSTWQTVLEAVDVVRLLDDPKASSTLYAVCVERSSPGQQILFRSRDGGRSWRRILTGVGGFAPDPLRRGRLWAAQGSAILLSRDRGETWERTGTAPAEVWTLTAGPARSGLLLAGTHGVSGVVISFDGGRTWARYNVGLARMRRSHADELIADPFVPGRFFALPLGGGAFEVTVPR